MNEYFILQKSEKLFKLFILLVLKQKRHPEGCLFI
jgi:hypothetical protein